MFQTPQARRSEQPRELGEIVVSGHVLLAEFLELWRSQSRQGPKVKRRHQCSEANIEVIKIPSIPARSWHQGVRRTSAVTFCRPDQHKHSEENQAAGILERRRRQSARCGESRYRNPGIRGRVSQTEFSGIRRQTSRGFSERKCCAIRAGHSIHICNLGRRRTATALFCPEIHASGDATKAEMARSANINRPPCFSEKLRGLP